ncbi:MAG: transcription antitermination factor NusB [Angelakisella sp.]|nr:transcription antitermination factor NusB [Angelakisella sp.]
MTRREAREQALAMIFEMNFNDNTVGEMVDNALIFRDEAIDPYAAQIAQQVRLHWAECIAAVGEFSKKWKASRLPKVSLSILLMAIAEIRYLKDAPVGAVINEAVELAKKYAAPEDAAYINGVLGGYVRGSHSDGEASPEEAGE